MGQLSGLSLVVGVALTRVLNRLGAPVRLKWPNDLLLGERKLAGILIELAGDALGPSAVVIGVGLNLLPAGDVGQPAAALREAGVTVSRNVLAAALLTELAAALGQFADEGFAPFQAEWQHWHAWQDETGGGGADAGRGAGRPSLGHRRARCAAPADQRGRTQRARR